VVAKWEGVGLGSCPMTRTIKRPGVAKANVARREATDSSTRMNALYEWEKWKQNPHFTLGLGLYIGEGTKTHRELVFTNADPNVMRLWQAWCSVFLPEVPMSLSIQIPTDVDPSEAKRFWKRRLGMVPRIYQSKGGTKGVGKFKHRKLPFGTARLRAGVGGTDAFVKMEYWISLCLMTT